MADTAPHTTELSERLDAKAADADGTTVLGDASEDATVTGATVTFDAAVTGDGTNNRTLTLRNAGQAGAGTTVVATLALAAGVNPAAGDEVALALTGTVADRDVSAGDVLELIESHAGSGLANPGALIEVTLSRR